MDIDGKVSMVEYGGKIRPKSLLDILEDYSEPPYVTRCPASTFRNFNAVGFRHINNKTGVAARLINVKTENMSGKMYSKFSQVIQRKIRNQTAKDFESVLHLFKKNYPARDATDLSYIYSVDPELCFVLEKEGKVIGAIMNHMRGETMHLKEIAVDSPYRGKGIGRNLVAKSLSVSRALGATSADVNSRDKTVGFYTALGWVPTGIWEYYIMSD